ncbi:MAG: HD domain-containing protein [Candidatus Woesearchaeota archaeon]
MENPSGEIEFLDDKIVKEISRAQISKEELKKIIKTDPVLRSLYSNMDCIEKSVNEEFCISKIFKDYCIYVFKDRKSKTKMFLEESEKDIKEIIKTTGINNFSPLFIQERKIELLSTEPYSINKSNTCFHQLSSMLIAIKIGRVMGISKEDEKDLAIGMTNHDIGKYLLPPEVLNKNGKLNEYEKKIIQAHPEIGANIIIASGYKIPERSLEIIELHHEKPDKKGYPKGISNIPYLVKIAQVADIFDALISERPYRPNNGAVPLRDAIDIIIEESKKGLLDKNVVDCLVVANRESRELGRGYYEKGVYK